MTMPDEDSIRHKYGPLPDEPRYRKKSKKRHVRSDHKHEYELVCIDAHTNVTTHRGRFPYYYIGMRCKVCGRMQNVRSRTDVHDPPAGMPLYEVEDFHALYNMKVLPEDRRSS